MLGYTWYQIGQSTGTGKRYNYRAATSPTVACRHDIINRVINAHEVPRHRRIGHHEHTITLSLLLPHRPDTASRTHNVTVSCSSKRSRYCRALTKSLTDQSL